ncbi:glycosyltransferase [Rathayibacter sp. YIM 133350]|uniref:glycosyltransferase family 2 protein n=1 Tax=Rathayibacter sp. YIM 133350 TaxID=3131992 RepID=UPI00307D4A3F
MSSTNRTLAAAARPARTRPEVAKMPRVTVVIPCYNYAHYLPEAVRSALDQPGVDVDVIIVDDASRDGSVDVARELAARDDRISVVAHETNHGHIATYNDGLGRAGGEYVVLLSADDLLAPGALARSTAVMEAHRGVGLVYGYAEDFVDVPAPDRPRRSSTRIWSGGAWLRRMCVRGSNTIVNPEAIMRRSVLESVGAYDPALPQTADMDLWMRAAAVSDVARVNGPVQAYYRVHGGNMHLTTFAGDLVDFRARLNTFDLFFAEGGFYTARDAGALHRIARRTMAKEALRRAGVLEGQGPEGRAASAEFTQAARECLPRIVRTPGWRLHVWRLGHPIAARPLARTHALLERARWSLRWRRWRRFGT